ncbi:MAG TPA: caspase family protein [Thermoanaerobaculia bacterium]|jgi:hypothetical protein
MPRLIFFLALLLATDAYGARRALLIGINEYSDWPSLSGAVNDVQLMEELLVQRYGFAQREIVTLTDRAATRLAILQALERLAAAAAKGDVTLFYYAGHGSQVRNSLSDEPDGFDESLVAADSRHIRDKELRPLFNRILDRGARLTIVLDNCHSGSGARGSAGVRAVQADPRDVRDPSHGPRPENRGALVITATQDDDRAWETRDKEGRMHGAFSWAWIRALRDAAPHEPVLETFLRAQAILRGETPLQEPLLAGNIAARQSPFLGIRARPARSTVAVEKIDRDGTVLLQGGRTQGLELGDELQTPSGKLRITALHGLTRSEATGSARPGQLLPTSSRADWRQLASPRPSPFRIDVRDRHGASVDRIVSGQRYEVFVQGEARQKRYLYLFVIDSRGAQTLLFPRSGSVENRFLRAPHTPVVSITAKRPYGDDTYILLTSDEPLPNPWILESGRRSPRPEPDWSIERRVIPSAAARR